MKGQNVLHDEVAENILKKACDEWRIACKAYDEAREDMQRAYREVSDKMESTSAAKKLADTSEIYYQTLREKKYRCDRYEGTRRAMLAKGWTEAECDALMYAVWESK